ncbi:MAG: hypothetical protein KY452_09215 [Actinobacteria bacterium]|nr:hypothetical protein [Actinomycetota bacterium]
MNVGAKARRRRPIYVESRIQASLDRVWGATQQPDQHQRWDVRFGSIASLPRVDGEPPRFTYASAVAPSPSLVRGSRSPIVTAPAGRVGRD